VGEVKWGRARRRDVERFIERAERFPGAERVFVSRRKVTCEGARNVPGRPRGDGALGIRCGERFWLIRRHQQDPRASQHP
jgi:hypothetical protein